MLIRRVVQDFVDMGPFPPESYYLASDDEALQADIEERQQRLERIPGPVSDDEARLLVSSFGPDLCFGLAWTLLHLIETAPSPAVAQRPVPDANEWEVLLWRRAGGDWPS